MYNENNSHLELIEKDGTITIPSIFMFDDYLVLSRFLEQARKMNCTVVFENENLTATPKNDNTYTRSKLEMYSLMVGTREFGNAYLRYLGNLDKMSWEKVNKL